MKIKEADCWPNVGQVLEEIRYVRNLATMEGNDVDVRLQVRIGVYDDGEYGCCWDVHFGSAQYDTDHRGFWGASSVPPNAGSALVLNIATDILKEAVDARHENPSELEEWS